LHHSFHKEQLELKSVQQSSIDQIGNIGIGIVINDYKLEIMMISQQQV